MSFYYYLLTASFNLEPTLNVTAFLAGILTVSPVLGFLPLLAFLVDTAYVPNPVKVIFLPPFNAFATTLWNAFNALSASALVIPASFDITGSKDRKLHELYYCNGIKLRKKILSIMSGEKLQKNEVLITRSYNVLADYIMHVNYDIIRESIINIMECARVNMIKTLVICLDNSIDQLVEIYDVIRDYLSKFDIMFDKVILSIENKEVLEKFIEKLKEEV